MSINWVMLSKTDGFTPLAGEQRLYTSPPRTSIALQSAIKYPGKQPFELQASAGSLYLTNRRIIYLPATPTAQVQSFAAPLLNLHDTHVTAPWFGPNVWTATLRPVPGGGVPPHVHALELRITFKDGGAFDFHSGFERIKERLVQAIEVARESGMGAAAAGNAVDGTAGVDLESVNLDELPAYEERASDVQLHVDPTRLGQAPAVSRQLQQVLGDGQRHTALGTAMGLPSAEARRAAMAASAEASPRAELFEAPAEPPPGYETVQRDSVAEELERRLRTEEGAT